MAYQSFEQLEVWQRARALAVAVYRLTSGLQDWALRDQLRRAAVSVASNIAEGAERNSSAEFRHFIGIAKGSAAEVRTQLYLLSDLKFADSAATQGLVDETKVLGAKLEALRQSLTPKS